MSVMNAELKFSERFANDLEKFVVWMSSNNCIIADVVTGEPIEWNENLIEFEEPGRNKLECYVKELMKNYSVVVNNEEVDDIKTMIRNFRENKPKKINNKKENKKTEIKQITKTEDDISKKEIKQIVVSSDINTEDVYYIDTLEFSTEELVNIFGDPLSNGTLATKHQYEWKIRVITEEEVRIYSIYNWMDKNKNFKDYLDNEWHLGTEKECPENPKNGCECQIKKIIEYLNLQKSKSAEAPVADEVQLASEQEQDRGEISDKQDDSDLLSNMQVEAQRHQERKENQENIIKELFNLSDDDDSIIDIDSIHF
jgi:hypothetical protein